MKVLNPVPNQYVKMDIPAQHWLLPLTITRGIEYNQGYSNGKGQHLGHFVSCYKNNNKIPGLFYPGEENIHMAKDKIVRAFGNVPRNQASSTCGREECSHKPKLSDRPLVMRHSHRKGQKSLPCLRIFYSMVHDQSLFHKGIL
jgi:hypothetical protein